MDGPDMSCAYTRVPADAPFGGGAYQITMTQTLSARFGCCKTGALLTL